MKKLINKLQAGKSMSTSFGVINFNNDGIAEVEDNVADSLKVLNNFFVEGEQKQEEPEQEKPAEHSDGENAQEAPENNPEEETQAGDSEEETDSKEAGEQVDYSQMDYAQLKQAATDKGLDFKNNAKKSDLIKMLQQAE
jgi:hypothetical protein